MIHLPDIAVVGGVLAVAFWMLKANLWRAVLCLSPASLALEGDAPADAMKLPRELEPLAGQLVALGFSPLGSHLEKPRFSRETECFDYVHAAEGAFATLSASRAGVSRLYLLTRTDSEGFVLTASYRRPARELPGRYFSGTLEGAPPERLLAAHRRRVAAMGRPQGPFTLEGRLEAARAWFVGPGRSEIRQANVVGLLWTACAIGMVAAAIFGRRA